MTAGKEINKDSALIAHILQCIEKVEDYTGNDEETFQQSSLIQDAVLRNLQILSESTQRLSQPLKDKYSEIPWRDISGFRNILVHDYLGIDLDTIWSVVDIELPKLKAICQQIGCNV